MSRLYQVGDHWRQPKMVLFDPEFNEAEIQCYDIDRVYNDIQSTEMECNSM